MNILESISYFEPYVSGLTIAASRLSAGLQKDGYRVTVLTMRHDPALPERETKHGRRVVRANWFARISKGFLSLDWFRKSWREVQNCDVLVVHLPQAEGIVPALLARFMHKKIIAYYHCEVMLPQGFINGMIQSLLEVSNMTVLWLSDHVVTYTADYAKASMLLVHVKTKVSYIIPPITTPRESKKLTKKFQKKIGNADIVIGVAARLSAEKGIEYLLEALPRVSSLLKDKKVLLAIAGPMEPVGEASYKEKIMKLVTTYKKQVLLLGEIPPPYMGSFYRLLDLLVLPSTNSTEAFGLVQGEAMLSGVPVVASDLPGVRVPVQKTGMGVVVTPGDSKKLFEGIAEVLRHPEAFRKDRNALERMFSADRSMRAFEKLLT